MRYWIGIVVGILLGSLQLYIFTSFISESDYHIGWTISKELEGYEWSRAYDFRGEYLQEQASAIITAPSFYLKADYRMIIFVEIGRILICADGGADFLTGFLFPRKGGFKTVMPDHAEIRFEIYKICSIRI